MGAFGFAFHASRVSVPLAATIVVERSIAHASLAPGWPGRHSHVFGSE